MRIALLGSTRSWYVADLRRAAGARHEILPCTFRDLAAGVGLSQPEARSAAVDLRRVDAVLVRAMPPGSLEQVVFRMDVLGQLHHRGVLVVNPPAAIEAAVDKYLALARIEAAGLRVPRTLVCQTCDEAMEAFARLGGDVVLKPLFGSEGRGITRLTDAELALRAFRWLEQSGAAIYLQEFIPHRWGDVRVLVVGERLLAMRRHNPHDWRTNAARGATCEPLELTPPAAHLAATAARAVGAPLAGVDLLPGDDGHWYVIEVNAVPGWRALAATLQLDVASLVLQFIETLAQRGPDGWPHGATSSGTGSAGPGGPSASERF
jgi:RimK family alpha-L-glutamate ligase